MIDTVEFKRWVNTLDNNSSVQIDDNGVIVQEVDVKGNPTGAYLEVGCAPFENDDDIPPPGKDFFDNAATRQGDEVIREGTRDPRKLGSLDEFLEETGILSETVSNVAKYISLDALLYSLGMGADEATKDLIRNWRKENDQLISLSQSITSVHMYESKDQLQESENREIAALLNRVAAEMESADLSPEERKELLEDVLDTANDLTPIEEIGRPVIDDKWFDEADAYEGDTLIRKGSHGPSSPTPSTESDTPSSISEI